MAEIGGPAPAPVDVAPEDCELCEAARFTHWYHEDEVCWVADCEACDCPMVVWKGHGVDAPAEAVEHMMAALANAGRERFGEHTFTIDRVMRQIPWLEQPAVPLQRHRRRPAPVDPRTLSTQP